MLLVAMFTCCSLSFSCSQVAIILTLLMHILLCYKVAFCFDHIGLILMLMNLNLNDIWIMLYVLEVHVKFVLIWHVIPVACCFHVCKVPTCCFGQIVVITCLECMYCTIAPFWACTIWKLLRIACSCIMSCWIHVWGGFSWCLSAFCINAMFNLLCSYLLGRSSELNELYM